MLSKRAYQPCIKALMTKRILIAIAALLCTSAYAAPTLHTTDFIANANRTNFVDFEPIGNTVSFGASFTQDGVSVNQVNGQLNDIWTGCFSSCWFSNTTLTWYPTGGDNGWTEITKADASDFVDMGLDLGSGFGPGSRSVLYELLLNGVSVLSGSIITPALADGYIGFSGGGFDQIRLRNTFVGGGNFGDGLLNALAIDNIELAAPAVVPEPGTLALLGLALAGAAISRRRSKT